MMEISFIILFTRFICLNYFYPLCTLLRGLCMRCGYSVCLVNRGSLVQIRVVANIEVMQIRIVIMFTKFICQNDFRPLSTLIRGAVA